MEYKKGSYPPDKFTIPYVAICFGNEVFLSLSKDYFGITYHCIL